MPTAMMSAPSPIAIIHAYRALFRASLVAVQYSKPARYAVRDKLRTAFRSRKPEDFNQERIDNTLHFLKAAGERVGMEHRIVRNLCMVHYWQQQMKSRKSIDSKRDHLISSYEPYYETVKLLNESAGLELI
ncbi:hypothetical protein DFH27DRAFT_542128 [Peziza echinospora]|nr:hypothetical protein DFH27DRAFT_542128 [Peziza echinospora]